MSPSRAGASVPDHGTCTSCHVPADPGGSNTASNPRPPVDEAVRVEVARRTDRARDGTAAVRGDGMETGDAAESLVDDGLSVRAPPWGQAVSRGQTNRRTPVERIDPETVADDRRQPRPVRRDLRKHDRRHRRREDRARAAAVALEPGRHAARRRVGRAKREGVARDRHLREARRHGDALRDGGRRARQRHRRGVEFLSHQRAVTNEQQMHGAVRRPGHQRWRPERQHRSGRLCGRRGIERADEHGVAAPGCARRGSRESGARRGA